MRVRAWTDRRDPAFPRAVIQRGDCAQEQCGQFSISISNGEIGLTVRFDSEAEFCKFMERGELSQPAATGDGAAGSSPSQPTRHAD